MLRKQQGSGKDQQTGGSLEAHAKTILYDMKHLLVWLAAASAFAAGGYHIIKKIPVPGNGGFDYLTVDEGARRLYVSHGTQVEVLEVDSRYRRKDPQHSGCAWDCHRLGVGPGLCQ